MALNHNAKTYDKAKLDLFVWANGFSEKSELVLCVGLVSENDHRAYDEIKQDHQRIVRLEDTETANILKNQFLLKDREGNVEDVNGSGDYVYAYFKPDPANPNA